MVRILKRLNHEHARPIAVLILCALGCSTIAVAAGLLGSLSYVEELPSFAGLTLQHLRPIHTTFAVGWIYLAACAVVYAYLIAQVGNPSRAFRLRLKGQLVLWGTAGAGLLVTLCLGIFSGREYMGGHWIWSIPIVLGWILFAWNFFSVVGFDPRRLPTFVLMWFVSMLLFLWAFAEAHGWHLPLVGDRPLRDIAIQWKSYGPLVGSFNLLVYGSLGYLGCCVSRDPRPAYSSTAFCLLCVGLLNSFTNFGHHTYHLPQSHLVKWISCVVSLTEAILVCKYALEVLRLVRQRSDSGVQSGMRAAAMWSFLLVAVALAISVPPLNSLIHGTHFVMAHAMGSMLGIDSMVLWTVLLFLLQRMLPGSHRLARPRAGVVSLACVNLGILLVVVLLSVKGAIAGYLRYMGPLAPAPPRFLESFPVLFIAFGAMLAAGILYINVSWAMAVLPFVRRTRTSTMTR